MTLDEAIEYEKESLQHCKRMLEEIYEDNLENKILKFEVKYHKQIADWLEELIMLRLDSCMIHMPERLRLVENGYNKAIDDFVKAIVDRGLSANDDKYCITHYDNYLKVIKEIAEQLKEQK